MYACATARARRCVPSRDDRWRPERDGAQNARLAPAPITSHEDVYFPQFT